jgi:hypothetical protein
VNVRLENGLQVCRDVTAFYKKKAGVEEAYAKSLVDLCKQVPSSGGGLGGLFARGPPALDKEGASLRGAILSVQEETGKIAAKHLEFATKINTDICAPLDAFTKTKDLEKKKLVADAQKYMKTFKDTQGAALRAKENYHKLGKEFETAKVSDNRDGRILLFLLLSSLFELLQASSSLFPLFPCPPHSYVISSINQRMSFSSWILKLLPIPRRNHKSIRLLLVFWTSKTRLMLPLRHIKMPSPRQTKAKLLTTQQSYLPSSVSVTPSRSLLLVLLPLVHLSFVLYLIYLPLNRFSCSQQLQEMDESRFATLSSAVQCYYIYQGSISAFIDEKSKDMESHLNAADVAADVKDFVDKTKTAPVPRPGDLTFEAFKVSFAFPLFHSHSHSHPLTHSSLPPPFYTVSSLLFIFVLSFSCFIVL